MLALKVLYDHSKEIYRRTRNGIKKQLIWSLTQRNLLRCILKYQNRLKTILIFVKVANLVRKK
jgi:hypothetical protein